MGRATGTEGQVVPLVAVVLGLAALGVVGVSRLGGEAGGRAAVQSVADVVALAGATGGEAAAREVATANGAELAIFEELEPFVQVQVRRGGHTGRATAERVVDAGDTGEEGGGGP